MNVRAFDVVLAVVCVASFAPGLTAPLTHYDDSTYLYQNTEHLDRPGLQGLLHQWDGSRAWNGDFIEFFPLRDSVYWAVYRHFQLEGWPYHVTSLLFHLAATLLLLRFLRSLEVSDWVSRGVALLFAVHPIHIESVIWAAGLKDPMYTAFLFASLWAYAEYRKTPRPGLYAASLIGLVLALLVKSMAISLPLILIALERLVGTPTPWKVIAQRVFGFGAVAGLFFVQFILIGRANDAVTLPHGGSWATHAVLAIWVQAKYLKQALVPSTFRLIYCFEPAQGLADWRLWVGLAAIVWVVVLFWVWRRRPLLQFGLAWYVACLLPVSNLVPFPALMADRYLYAALFGALLVVVSLLESFVRVRQFALAAIALALGATTAARSAIWQDEEDLWREPDEDPACMVDPAHWANDAHLLRAYTAKNELDSLLAFERALAAPSLPKSAHGCEILQVTANAAARLNFQERGAHFAALAAMNCPYEPQSWFVAMQTNVHRKPLVAAAAAEKMHRLRPTRLGELYVALTRLELGLPESAEKVIALTQQSPEATCTVVLEWVEQVAAHGPVLREAIERCVEVARARGAPSPVGP